MEKKFEVEYNTTGSYDNVIWDDFHDYVYAESEEEAIELAIDWFLEWICNNTIDEFYDGDREKAEADLRSYAWRAIEVED